MARGTGVPCRTTGQYPWRDPGAFQTWKTRPQTRQRGPSPWSASSDLRWEAAGGNVAKVSQSSRLHDKRRRSCVRSSASVGPPGPGFTLARARSKRDLGLSKSNSRLELTTTLLQRKGRRRHKPKRLVGGPAKGGACYAARAWRWPQ